MPDIEPTWSPSEWIYSGGSLTRTATINNVGFEIRARYNGLRLSNILISVTDPADAEDELKTESATEETMSAAILALQTFVENNTGSGTDKAF